MTTNIFGIKKQQYISWKGSGINSNSSGITARNIRPLTNNDKTNTTSQKIGLGMPRPMKHYRRGYYTTNERYVASSTGGNLIKQLIDTPGSVSFQSYDNKICKNCRGVVVINNWDPITNLTENPTPETQQHPPGLCCNEQQKSLKMVRSPNTIVKQNYYTTHEKYLLNRSKLFNQTQFNYLNKGNPQSTPGDPNSLNNTYTGNAILKIKNCIKAQVIYKPTNYKFSKEGAVSGSDRILRLNLETINKNKHDIQNHPQAKSKYFPNASSSGIIHNCSRFYNSTNNLKCLS